MRHCVVAECRAAHYGRQLCFKHYQQWWRGQGRQSSLEPMKALWRAMLSRCYNRKCKAYPRYGGRGVQVCESWRRSFETFYADMGDRPMGRSLDRIDNDGDYTPSNCRWATPSEQNNNQQSNRVIVYNGVAYTLAQLARKTGLRAGTLRARVVDLGWSIADAVEIAPVPGRGRGDAKRIL